MPQTSVTLAYVGHEPDVAEVYRTVPRRDDHKPLDIHVYLGKTDAPAPLLTSAHAAGVRVGRTLHKSHRVIARHLTQAGISAAIPQYRLAAAPDDIGDGHHISEAST